MISNQKPSPTSITEKDRKIKPSSFEGGPMPQLRQDPTTKEWVIIAAERSKRPHDFVKTKT